MTIQTPRIALLSATSMTPIERQMGRFMRAPDHQPADQSGLDVTDRLPANNAEENKPPAGTDPTNQNNSGQPFDLKSFWSGEPGDGDEPPSGESDGPKPKPGEQQQEQQSQVPDIAKVITETNFGELLTPAMLEKFGNGDVEDFNKGLNGFGQAVMKHTLVQSVGIMRQLRQQIFDEVDQRLNGRLTSDRQFDELTKAIPSASDPRMGPTIRTIYSQALKHSKGDIPQAITQTKQVMQMQAEIFGGDLNLTVAPKTAMDSSQPPKTENWLESLVGN